jgi:hypothetical protein
MNAGLYTISKKTSKSHSELSTTYGNGTMDRSVIESMSKGSGENFGMEGSWEPNKHHLVSLEFNGSYYGVKPQNTTSVWRYGDGGLMSSYVSNTHYRKFGLFDFDGNVNYQFTTDRKDELLTASYAVSSMNNKVYVTTEYDDVVGDLFNYSCLNGDNNLNFIEHTFQADWTRPFGDMHTFEIGGKYILRRNTSDGDNEYVGWETLHNEFKHITDVGALYAQYTAKIKKVALRAGLRYEYSKLKAEYPDGSSQEYSSEFNDVVPSASMSWNINNVHSMTFSYAGRVNRPGINLLNPTVMYTPTSISYGNPDLKSAFYNSLSMRYMFIKRKINFNISASYAFSNDNVSVVTFLDNEGMVHTTYDNVGLERGFSVSGYMQWSMTNKTRIMLNGTASYSRRRQGGYELSRWRPMVFVRVSQDLPWKLSLNVGCSYFGMGLGSVYTYTKNESPIPVEWDLSLQRSFLKQRRLNVSLTASNFIGYHHLRYVIHRVNGDYTGLDSNTSNMKRVSLTVSYRFGSLNAYVKKTQKNITNDDLVGKK